MIVPSFIRHFYSLNIVVISSKTLRVRSCRSNKWRNFNSIVASGHPLLAQFDSRKHRTV